MCVENVIGCKLGFSRQNTSFYTFKYLDKSVVINLLNLSLANTKIINQYRSPYTPPFFRIPTILWVQHYNLQVYDEK